MTEAIPFLDLVTPHRELREEFISVFDSALHRAAFIGGEEVERFEREFASFCGTSHCIGVGSGTDALRFALTAVGVGPGDIVITVPNTFIATTEAITQAGARPAFVDVDPHTYNMQPVRLEEYLVQKCRLDDQGRLIDLHHGARVAAVIPVHLYGQTADMDPISALAEKYGLALVEDACQAHGAEYFSKSEGRWKKAGSMGAAAAFSFYPGKNLGACGEAGAVTTNRERIAKHVKMLRDHGQAKKYYHDIEGYNGRLDAIQAGILRIKLRRLAEWNESRRRCAAAYRSLLSQAGEAIRLPNEPSWSKAVYHLFVVGLNDREGAQKHLAEANIGTGIHYPIPLHLQTAYRRLGLGAESFAVAEKSAREILSLPMFPGLKFEQQKRTAEELMRFACAQKPAAFAAHA